MTDTADTVPSDSISLAAARRVLDAALAHAESMSRVMCITVCDPAGDPVLSARMDGAPRLTAQIAADKAWTVAGFNGVPTHDWWPMIEHNPALVHGITQDPAARGLRRRRGDPRRRPRGRCDRRVGRIVRGRPRRCRSGGGRARLLIGSIRVAGRPGPGPPRRSGRPGGRPARRSGRAGCPWPRSAPCHRALGSECAARSPRPCSPGRRSTRRSRRATMPRPSSPPNRWRTMNRTSASGITSDPTGRQKRRSASRVSRWARRSPSRRAMAWWA